MEDFHTIESLIEDCSDGFNGRYRNEVRQGSPVSRTSERLAGQYHPSICP
jgi:hypothetical protein